MFKLFRKRTVKEKLEDQYESLMKEWHKLSQTNRAASDKKYAEAQEVLQKIEAIK